MMKFSWPQPRGRNDRRVTDNLLPAPGDVDLGTFALDDVDLLLDDLEYAQRWNAKEAPRARRALLISFLRHRAALASREQVAS